VFTLKSTTAALGKATADEFGRVRTLLDTPSMPTTALHMQALEPGKEPPPFRTTANEIIAVVSGSGSTRIEGQDFTWKTGDVVAIPAWNRFAHTAASSSMLFSVSDEAMLSKLGFLRSSAD
jgi:gentisate 1,2-dioxygenase